MAETGSIVSQATSLEPLPSGPEIRDAVRQYLDASPKPSDTLREMADAMDAGLFVGFDGQAVAEADGYLEDYRSRIYRRSVRFMEAEWTVLQNHATATGLTVGAIIRLALQRF